jgi:uncharacterized protein
MFRKNKRFQALAGAAVLALVELAGVAVIAASLTSPAQAQRYDDRYPFLRHQQRPSGGGFFQNLFGISPQPRSYPNDGLYGPGARPAEQPHYDTSRAPPPRKPAPNAEPVAPTTTVVVMGDGMADWLSYGLEDAFSDTPSIAVVRKDHNHSGLLRYDSKSDLDWWHVARDILTQEKANYVVMMIGVSDRQNIRERDLAKEAEKNKEEQDKKEQDKKDGKKDDKKAAKDDKTDNPDQLLAPESRGKRRNGVIEFRSDKWAEIYSRRIDATIAALKSKGVPVIWVGLPAIRGTRSTADAGYLNDLFRARAERAGVDYVDVWDGFVDEAGKFSSYGPDYEGQTRRLRSGDGVYFTKAGARKLAHYVEREIRRYMANHAVPVALPSGPIGPTSNEGKSTERPLAGPVVPLTITSTSSDELMGGAGTQLSHNDAIAARVLVRGEPLNAPAGRADDFKWPLGSDAYAKAKDEKPASAKAKGNAPAKAKGTAPSASIAPPAAISATQAPAAAAKAAVAKPAAAPKAKKEKKIEVSQEADPKPKPVRPRETRPPVQRDNAPRPPGSIPSGNRTSGSSSGGLSDFFR